ncbi:MAG: ATP-binding protein, partial [Candidatus Cloacimonetes bacterium]|nr:ATP-binding protein [Candidatus Cloacimonadota bacterium]
QINIEVPDQYKINTDRQLFGTIMRNLISNAIKYSKSEQSITISAFLQDELIIVVEDNGVGIPRAEQKPSLIWTAIIALTARSTKLARGLDSSW